MALIPRVGDRARVIGGPLKGRSGVIARVSRKHRTATLMLRGGDIPRRERGNYIVRTDNLVPVAYRWHEIKIIETKPRIIVP
jgi:ribosomal protein L24